MPADGNAAEKRDTEPCPPPRMHRGQQDERGTLCPDIHGELPWPVVNGHGRHLRTSMLVSASMRHRRLDCYSPVHPYECDDEGSCQRHRETDVVAEAAEQIATILEQAMRRAEVDGECGDVLVGDILSEARRLL